MNTADLDASLIAAVEAIGAGKFGEDLRRFNPGRRDAGTRSSLLSGMELNHPPPIQRTVRILFTARLAGMDLRLTDEDRTYLAWVGSAVRLVEALVNSWWGEINPDVRTIFVDGDDAPPLVLINSMFPNSRVRRPASLRLAAATLAMTDRELTALSLAARATRKTEAFAAAVGATRLVLATPINSPRTNRDARTSRRRPDRPGQYCVRR